MAVELPDWFDTCYIQKILQNAEKDESIMVSALTAKSATAKGDNFASDLHRVTVEYSRVENGRDIQERKCLIVKYAPNGDARAQIVEGFGYFETELSVLEIVLPGMNGILEKIGLPPSLGPLCFHTQYKEPTHVIIEDLAPRGFRMANREAGLDLDHCLLAIKNLARFHAASIALKEKDSKLVTRYCKGMFHKDHSEPVHNFFYFTAKCMASEATNWPELSPQIKKKIVELSEVFYERACEAAKYQEDDFNVLNHGDFWTNNMLFHYDEHNHPVDHIFLDFQICNWGSPAIDLLYFFGSSPAEDVRLNHRELLLREYHTLLSNTTTKLKCSTEIPTFDKLQEVLKHRAFFEVAATMTVLAVVVADEGNEIDFNDFQPKDGKYENPAYRGKNYRKIMTKLLPLFDSMGLLDV